MKKCLSAAIVTLASCIIACGGGGGGPSAVRTPSTAAPRDVIAFGATDESGDSALYVVKPDGKDVQKLSDEAQIVSFPRWSPDGARIAYVVGGGGRPGTEASLRIYDFDGAVTLTVSEHVLTSGDEAPMAWSPAGDRIAFIEAPESDATGGGTLRIYDFDKRKVLDKHSVTATAVDWSAKDTLAIVAPSEDASTSDVYRLKPGDNEPRLLLARDGVESELAWSFDGETLAFWSGPSADITQRTLLTILMDGATSPAEIGPGLDPVWSKNRRLAYSGPPSPGARGALDIYATTQTGPAPQRLTEAVTYDRWPTWSPKEDAIAYLAQADPSTAFLCLTTLATRDNTCLDLSGLTPGAPEWSPY